MLDLSFAQIGLITLTYQLTASLLQPMVGLCTDRHPKPYSLAFGMSCTLVGLLVLAIAPDYATLLLAAGLVGMGSSMIVVSGFAGLAKWGERREMEAICPIGNEVLAPGTLSGVCSRSGKYASKGAPDGIQ